MTTLDNGFERDLQEAVLADVEAKFVVEEANLVFQFVELVHSRLRSYGRRNGYDVESTIESFGTPQLDRSKGRVAVTVGWESEQMARWEFGVSPHTIDGDPVLSFVWENPPEWVKEEFDQGRNTEGEFVSGWRVFFPSVDHPGIPASRAIRDSLRALEQVIGDG
jgi:hypothetical protein